MSFWRLLFWMLSPSHFFQSFLNYSILRKFYNMSQLEPKSLEEMFIRPKVIAHYQSIKNLIARLTRRFQGSKLPNHFISEFAFSVFLYFFSSEHFNFSSRNLSHLSIRTRNVLTSSIRNIEFNILKWYF
jgi:hypothetical protein